MVNIKNFDPSLLEINKLSGKSTIINIYHIEYMTMKSLDHVNTDSENPFYLTFNNADGYIIGKRNGDKYFSFASTNKKKEVLKKMKELMLLKELSLINQISQKNV